MDSFGVSLPYIPVRPVLLTTGALVIGFYFFSKLFKRKEETENPEDAQGNQVPMETVTEVQIQNLMAMNTQLEDKVKQLEELLSGVHRDYDIKIKDFQAEAEKKHQQKLEVINHLTGETFGLIDQVEVLRKKVQDMENLLCDNQHQCEELKSECEQKQEANHVLKVENDEMKATLVHKEVLLKDLQVEAEVKYQQDLEIIAQLEDEKSELTVQLEEMRGQVQDAWTILLKSRDVCETLMKIFRAEAEAKHHKDLETITQLKDERSVLIEKVEMLRETVRDMEKLLFRNQSDWKERENECKQVAETHSIVQAQTHDMKTTRTDNLLNGAEENAWYLQTLQVEYEDTLVSLSHYEKLLKDMRAKTEEKCQQALETIAQLEGEKSELTEQLEKVHVEVQLLSTDQDECEALINENISLISSYNKMNKQLKGDKTSHQALRTETEEKHQDAVKSKDQQKPLTSHATDELCPTIAPLCEIFSPHPPQIDFILLFYASMFAVMLRVVLFLFGMWMRSDLFRYFGINND